MTNTHRQVLEILEEVERGSITLEQAADHLELIGVDPADYAGEFEVAAWYAAQGV